jgi:hypothetical protein
MKTFLQTFLLTYGIARIALAALVCSSWITSMPAHAQMVHDLSTLERNQTIEELRATQAALLGKPLGPPKTISGGGRVQHFKDGSIYQPPTGSARIVRGAILKRYHILDGPAGWLGHPKSKRLPFTYMKANNGTSPKTETGYLQHFAGGTIIAPSESPVIGPGGGSSPHAYALGAAILKKYRNMKGPRGALGLPIRDERRFATNARVAFFEKGQIIWSPQTGAHDLRSPIFAVYRVEELGLPESDHVEIAGGAYTRFKRGAIYWSPKHGAHRIPEPFYKYFEDKKNSGKPLGFPTSDPYKVPGTQDTRMIFEKEAVDLVSEPGAVDRDKFKLIPRDHFDAVAIESVCISANQGGQTLIQPRVVNLGTRALKPVFVALGVTIRYQPKGASANIDKKYGNVPSAKVVPPGPATHKTDPIYVPTALSYKKLEAVAIPTVPEEEKGDNSLTAFQTRSLFKAQLEAAGTICLRP